jgi:ABC-type multidrug transport system ATPase subunit
LLKQLGITGITAHTTIGSPFKKTLSGGEKKRVAIGVEMITDPKVLMLDEPTSGLDSFKALSIVKLLCKLARKGKTVIATIHQPGSDAFNCFDQLILMTDGHIAYQGKAKKCNSYLREIGFTPPRYSNPADYYMKILSV